MKNIPSLPATICLAFLFFLPTAVRANTAESKTITVDTRMPDGVVLRADNPLWDTGRNAPMITLYWSDAGSATGFDILRGGKVVATLGLQNAYTDTTGLAAGVAYTYQVRAKNAVSTTLSNAVKATMLKTPPAALQSFTLSSGTPTLSATKPKTPSVTLTWSKALNATTYDVFRDGIRIGVDVKALTFKDSVGLSQGGVYTYSVLAKGPGGTAHSNPRQLTMPTEVAVTVGSFTLANEAPYWDSRPPAGPSVKLKWSAAKGAASYEVYRDGSLIATLSGLTFVNEKGLTPGGTHRYFVRAVYNGASADSKEIAVVMPEGPVAATQAVALQNAIPVSYLSGAAGSSRCYSIVIPEGVASLEVSTSGGTGDVDLYARKGTKPDLAKSLFDTYSRTVGNAETVTVASPVAKTTYYILVQAALAYSGVSLTAKLVPGAATVATPEISPVPGAYTDPVVLAMSCSTPGASVYYTLDGSTPSPASAASKKYDSTAPPVVYGATTVKAIAAKAGLATSPVATQSYTSPPVSQTVLANGTKLGLSWLAGEDKIFRLDVDADDVGFSNNMMKRTAAVSFLFGWTNGLFPRSNFDVYVQKDRVPTPSDCLPIKFITYGTFGEEILFGPQDLPGGLSGKWYVRIRPRNSIVNNVSIKATSYPVELECLSGNIDPSKETWIVSHGRASDKEQMRPTALGLSIANETAQVVLLDWHAAAASNVGAQLLWGSRFIVPVATKAQEMIRQVGSIPGSKISWVGHSWGALTGYEFARIQNYQTAATDIGANGRICRFIALDPAFGAQEVPNSVLSSIGINALLDAYPRHTTLSFSSVAAMSWSFVSPQPGISFGSASKAATAHESSVITFKNLSTTFSLNGVNWDASLDQRLNAHSGVVKLFDDMLWDNYSSFIILHGQVAPYFALSKMDQTQPRWMPDRFNSIGTPTFALVCSNKFPFETSIGATLLFPDTSNLISIDSVDYFAPSGIEISVPNQPK